MRTYAPPHIHRARGVCVCVCVCVCMCMCACVPACVFVCACITVFELLQNHVCPSEWITLVSDKTGLQSRFIFGVSNNILLVNPILSLCWKMIFLRWCGNKSRNNSCTAWCSEFGSLTSPDAWNAGASSDVREPISLHQTVCSLVSFYPFFFFFWFRASCQFDLWQMTENNHFCSSICWTAVTCCIV